MLYEHHFGLMAQPFALTPNRALFFPEIHGPILEGLTAALDRGEGIVKLSGEVGTGKTMISRMLLERIEAAGWNFAYLVAPNQPPSGVVAAVAREFGIEPGEDPATALGQALARRHAEGRRAVLVVDEAQALGPRGLEAIRLLTNLETDEAKLLQIVLIGQTELDDLLARTELRQLAQRIGYHFETRPFTLAEVGRYLDFRIAGSSEGEPRQIFTNAAKKLIAVKSGGLPRLVNILADKSLLAAFAEREARVEPDHVREALADGGPAFERPSLWRRIASGGRIGARF